MPLSLDYAPKDGREVTLLVNLAPFDGRSFFARCFYHAERGWVGKRDLIGQEGYELVNVNALGCLL